LTGAFIGPQRCTRASMKAALVIAVRIHLHREKRSKGGWPYDAPALQIPMNYAASIIL
jgi:hypothetical protein